MSHISLRVTEEEKAWMENYADLHGVSLSVAVKEAFFEKLEDEYDLNCIRLHEAEKAKGRMKYFTMDEVKKELNVDDEI